MTNRGEMPFLDHLEELRWRILWSLLALVLGTVAGFLIVQYFDVLTLLKRPIAPYLADGRLFITRPTDAFMLTIKLAFIVGLILAAPVIGWQLWRFLSPALYDREKRLVLPALSAGLVLFLSGVFIAYTWVLPAALRILFSFQRDDLEPIITAAAYLTFALQVILAFGAMFEVPLVIVMLAALGIVDPAFFRKHRPIALVVGAVVSAFLTPPDAVSLFMLLIPLVFLYEGGILVASLVWRKRRARTIGAAAAVLLLLAIPGAAEAQQPRLGVPAVDEAQSGDTTGAGRAGQALDTATARRLGLPTAPSRRLPDPDSVMAALLNLPGYRVIRYAADSIVLHADTQAVELVGRALVEQEGATLEADTVQFRQAACRLNAQGAPSLFDRNTVLVGEAMRYDTCERRGFVDGALTNFSQSGVEWFLRGGLAVDSASVRMYASRSAITSDDLPNPTYHFSAGEIKWVSNTFLVARPAVLYVRDVPVMWLPFVFQDMRTGRRSGILIPRFGINDIVRPNRGYRRHITNFGYYVVLNEYMDARASLDWFAETSVSVNGQLRYRWLDRFVTGALSVSRIFEDGGARSLRLQWGHQQSFDMRTRLNASVDYASSARVMERNAVDPFLVTATLGSSVNFSKQFDWGSLDMGGNRRQELTSGSVTQTVPTIRLTPRPIDIAHNVTWSPSVSFTTTRAFNQRGPILPGLPVPGDTLLPPDTLRLQNRSTDFRFATPLRVGRWNWSNDFTIRDQVAEQRSTVRVPDPGNPADTLIRYYGIDFSTGVDWNTSINLPSLFPGTWKLQPSVGVLNTTSGPFMIRNRNTAGSFVTQGKRLTFGASISPTFFGFFPGVGPIERIRHAVSPRAQWGYAPAANIPEAYARAMDPTRLNPVLRSPVQNRLSVGLAQNIEGKLRAPPGDTARAGDMAPQGRKVKLLNIQTSSITYDFEQAKEPGRTGWQTSTISNQVTSDLLPGFTLGVTHDLWEGAVGTDTARFSPFMSRVSARFSLSQSTFSDIFALIVGREVRPGAAGDPIRELAGDTLGADDVLPRPPGTESRDILSPARRPGMRRPLTLSVTYDDQRSRPVAGQVEQAGFGSAVTNQTLGLALVFDPTEHWSVSWNTQYNMTSNEFGQHALRLERDLRRWRASFQFLKAPNGNFSFSFFITLMDQPEIRFNYDQRTVQRP